MGMLPQELVDFVIDGLSDDWHALAACAHVHPDWAPRAHSHLRRGIVLTIDWPDCPDLDDFSHVFCPSSSLASDVSILSICGPPQLSDTSDLLLIPDTLVLDHLPRLRSLTLRSFLVSDVGQLITALKSCENLEELHIEGVGVELTATGSITSKQSYTATIESSSRPILARLKTLCMQRCDSKLFAPLLRPLARLLGADADSPCPVQSLSFHLVGYEQPIEVMYGPILNMRKTITDLSISVPIPLDRFIEYSDCTRFTTAIARCRHLRRLVLRYNPPGAARSDDNVDFMHALSRFFSGGASAGIFQELEVFTVVLPRRDAVSRLETALARLGQVVTKEAFPALRRVRFGVECGRDGGAQDMVEQIDSALRPLREGGIVTEVAALPGDEWETWSASVMAGASR